MLFVLLSTIFLTVTLYYFMGFPFKIKIFYDAHFRIHRFSNSYCVEVKTKMMRRAGHESHVRKRLSDN